MTGYSCWNTDYVYDADADGVDADDVDNAVVDDDDDSGDAAAGLDAESGDDVADDDDDHDDDGGNAGDDACSIRPAECLGMIFRMRALRVNTTVIRRLS
ncbi:MAG: hypothetical protein ACKPKO_53430 [Candidatus Fonsibacter sp.]